MTINISNFYLNTPMKRYEYLLLNLRDIPEEIIQLYNICNKATKDGRIYVNISKGMYGLPQDGLLAQELLKKRLSKHGYFQSKLVPGLCKHQWRPIQFTLVVEYFGVKYVGKKHSHHLMSALNYNYTINHDLKGSKYVGITLDWDYDGRKVHLLMTGYISEAVIHFRHKIPTKRQDSPYLFAPVKYGKKTQNTKAPDYTPLLDNKGKNYIQCVHNTLL